MYFEDPTPVKCDEIRAFVGAVRRAMTLSNSLGGDRRQRFYDVKKELLETSQATLRNGRHYDGDTAKDIALFLDRLVGDPDFKQYMLERTEKIEMALGKGGGVEVVPLRHQYGNYRAMLMSV